MAERLDVSDIVEIDQQYYILATSSLADEQDRVLKHGDTFALFDRYGDIKPVGLGEEGLYHDGTRYLSRFLLRMGRVRPLLLSSTVREDNALLAVDLTNLDVSDGGKVVVPRGTLHLARTAFLWNGVLYQQLCLRNYGLQGVSASIVLTFGSDYVDIFEVRGTPRPARGVRLPTEVTGATTVLAYRGLDNVERRTRIQIDPLPTALDTGEARMEITLEPGAEVSYEVTIGCESGVVAPQPVQFGTALAKAGEVLRARRADSCHIYTANEQFNDWLARSLADLTVMISDTEHGAYPYAGVPWYSTPFGRDGIITAFEVLWANPALARGVLSYLAARQADFSNPAQEAEPGKILHEVRGGEMAALGEIPFGCYYGSHDSTPLFVMLAAAYYERSGDRGFVEGIWPNLLRALEWIERYGDRDGDGLVDYQRQGDSGLVHQGWKDSLDSVFHQDGRLAEGPIAMCELQGYVYAAWLGAARLARLFDAAGQADEFEAKATALRERFEKEFWSDALGTYVLALDGEKHPCQVRTSNAGHALWSGIASPERAAAVARALLAPDSFSGWGIRTVSTSERRYNPMSYHNGSVWPHDNALVGMGFSRYGLHEATQKVLAGLFDASLFVDLHRLPELFCGFTRRPGEAPTLYPVACSPQTWASGSVFLLLQAVLGLEISAPERRIQFRNPRLPPFLEEVRITDLRVGDAVLDLDLRRHKDDVGIEVTRRTADIEVERIP
jgi:glycogen debranching enzyme